VKSARFSPIYDYVTCFVIWERIRPVGGIPINIWNKYFIYQNIE